MDAMSAGAEINTYAKLERDVACLMIFQGLEQLSFSCVIGHQVDR